MSKIINEDKLRISLSYTRLMETTLEWEVENKLWLLDIMSLTLPVQCSMLHHNLIGSRSTHQSHSLDGKTLNGTALKSWLYQMNLYSSIKTSLPEHLHVS